VFLAWNPLFAWEISGQAHSEGLVLVGLLVFVWAALRSREWLAVLGASCAVLSKIVLLPLLGLYLCFVARRRPLRALAMAGAAAGNAGSLGGEGPPRGPRLLPPLRPGCRSLVPVLVCALALAPRPRPARPALAGARRSLFGAAPRPVRHSARPRDLCGHRYGHVGPPLAATAHAGGGVRANR